MKLLLLSPLPPPVGGIASWTKIVLSMLGKDDLIDFRLVNTAVRWRSITDSNLVKRIFFGSLNASLLLKEVIFGILIFRPNVIHISSPCEIGLIRDCVFLLFAKIFKIPSVLHFHRGKVPDFPDLMKIRSVESLLVRASIFLSTRVIVLNQPAFLALCPYGKDKISIVGNMIDYVAIRQLHKTFDSENINFQKNKQSIIFVGHVVERKGIFDLVHVVHKMIENHPNLQLIVVGPYEEQIKLQLLKVAELTEKTTLPWLRFTGALDQKRVFHEIYEASIFCLPSYAEGFPYVMLEAMALGKPIISTDVGAIPFVLKNGAGICNKPGDLISLEQSIFKLINDLNMQKQMGSISEDRCRSMYSSEVVYKELSEIWINHSK